MKTTNTLYVDTFGCNSFGGVINKENKGLVMVYDEYNCDEIQVEQIPIGINMLLFRTMEDALDIHKVNRKAKYITKLLNK
jgi:hypothetical protein